MMPGSARCAARTRAGRRPNRVPQRVSSDGRVHLVAAGRPIWGPITATGDAAHPRRRAHVALRVRSAATTPRANPRQPACTAATARHAAARDQDRHAVCGDDGHRWARLAPTRWRRLRGAGFSQAIRGASDDVVSPCTCRGPQTPRLAPACIACAEAVARSLDHVTEPVAEVQGPHSHCRLRPARELACRSRADPSGSERLEPHSTRRLRGWSKPRHRRVECGAGQALDSGGPRPFLP